MKLGRGSMAIAGTRMARASAGRTQANVLAGVATGANPDAVAANVEETPTMPDAPMTGGDGLEIDEGTSTGPFVTDDASEVAPEDSMVPS
jgi:hypothetical protein